MHERIMEGSSERIPGLILEGILSGMLGGVIEQILKDIPTQ